MTQKAPRDIKHVYVQYSKRITTACLIAFFITVCGTIGLVTWAGLNKIQIDALVNILQMVSVFETGVIASYATNSIFEKNFAAKYGEIRSAFSVEKNDTAEETSEGEVAENG